MRLWKGNVNLDLDEPGKRLEDVEFHSHDHEASSLPSDAQFSFLALLDNSRIPIHLIAGPALAVYTVSDDTVRWFEETLLRSTHRDDDDPSQHNSPHTQSDVGVLLKVESNGYKQSSKQQITELLLYASTPTTQSRSREGILTPPRSSSPTHEEGGQSGSSVEDAQQMQVYALPLSSDLRLVLPTAPSTPNITTEHVADNTASFLSFSEISDRANQRKRQKLDTLFEDATQANKKAKRHSGQHISNLMSNDSKSSYVQSPVEDATATTELRIRKRPKALSTTQPLSRSSSMGSLRDLEDSRPTSRSGPLARTQRSNLHRVTSLSRLESISPTQSPGPENVPWNEVEQQNKMTLSRIVMAGMRMYGLQQRKKSNHKGAETEVSHNNVQKDSREGVQDDEYKLVYHQTYKSVAFVLRRQMGLEIIAHDFMRDQVDRLLAIFCVDPREAQALSSFDQSIVNAQALGVDGAFDRPSYEVSRPETEVLAGTD